MLCGLLVLGLAAIIGGGLLYYHLHKGVELDTRPGGTLCPLSNGVPAPESALTIIVDATDPLTPIQGDYLKMSLNNMVRDAATGTLISVYTINGAGEISRRPSFQKCKIRDGSDADEFTENEKKLRKRFKKEFEQPFKAEVESLIRNTGTAKESPIFEQIQAVSINTIQKWHPEGEQKLVLFSDMLHNSKGYSMYRDKQNYEAFKKTPYASTVRTNLTGVSVELYYFINKAEKQKNMNVEFWKQYFKDAGAALERVESVGK